MMLSNDHENRPKGRLLSLEQPFLRTEWRISDRGNTTSTTLSKSSNMARIPQSPATKKDRKRMLANAEFYSECFLNGIPSRSAEAAASEVQEHYDRWWIQTQHQPNPRPSKRQLVEVTDYVKATDQNEGDQPAAYVTSEDEDSVVQTRGLEISLNGALISRQVALGLTRANERVLDRLLEVGGDSTDLEFLSAVDALNKCYVARGWDARWTNEGNEPFDVEGRWLSRTKPTYTECQGTNRNGELIYSLGRLCFDMFRPTQLLCSLQGVYNRVSKCSEDSGKVPTSFPFQMRHLAQPQHRMQMRKYEIAVSFTIEPGQNRRGECSNNDQPASSHNKGEYIVNRPIRGTLTNHGYSIPDPSTKNRLSIWFSGGSLSVDNPEQDLVEWQRIFDESTAPRRDVMELARLLGARILLGASLPESIDDDGTIHYSLKRPIGGHGRVFCDVLYADDHLRVMKGHRGSIFVFTRVMTP